ncbi:MAG: hypothetical protein MUF50_03635 [Planctomycetes bacterium]|nr:hypothetical protein [Planctomycetota bacterium]
MKKIAKTKGVLLAYNKGGIKAVHDYLFNPELEFKKETWAFKAKNLLEHNCWRSLEAEINLILYKNDFNGKETEELGGENS